jgi:hypothetical protein
MTAAAVFHSASQKPGTASDLLPGMQLVKIIGPRNGISWRVGDVNLSTPQLFSARSTGKRLLHAALLKGDHDAPLIPFDLKQDVWRRRVNELLRSATTIHAGTMTVNS